LGESFSFLPLVSVLVEMSGAVLMRQDDGIINPEDTRDVLGLGLELAAEERASRQATGSVAGSGSRGEIGADGDAGGWGVFRM
jgi:hypothetical protein